MSQADHAPQRLVGSVRIHPLNTQATISQSLGVAHGLHFPLQSSGVPSHLLTPG